MMRFELIAEESFSTSRWSGGTTTELFIYPGDASYAQRRFDLRISAASVSLEESVFTPLPGVTRYITPLCDGGFTLYIGSLPARCLIKGEVACFDGGEPVRCVGSGRDLNLMLRGVKGGMRCIAPRCAALPPLSRFVFVYADGETDVICGENSFHIPAHGIARLAPKGHSETMIADAPMVLIWA